MNKLVLFPQLFAEDGGAAAPAGGGAEATPAAGTEAAAGPVRVGDTLADGTTVEDARVAAALTRQMNRHPEMRKVYGQTGAQPAGKQAGQPAQAQPAAQGQQGNPAGEPTIEQRWEEFKKGEYKELYGRDVQNAIRERFKNQADVQQQLDGMQPMLQALMKKTGAESVEELQKLIMDDDSLYEEEAEEAGMPVERYKEFKRLQEEHDQRAAEDQRRQEMNDLQNHIMDLKRQAEELKQVFPAFNLDQEVLNPEFRKLTGPGGISVKQAYMALHGEELIPQLLGYGMDRAKQQMGQTIQAQRMRPAEGAMNGQSQVAAEPKIDPAKLSRKEREMYKQLVRKNVFVSFD